MKTKNEKRKGWRQSPLYKCPTCGTEIDIVSIRQAELGRRKSERKRAEALRNLEKANAAKKAKKEAQNGKTTRI